MKQACAIRLEDEGVLDMLIRLMDATQNSLAVVKSSPTPKYAVYSVLVY